MIKKIKENRKTLSLVKGTDISDKVYDKEVTRRIYEVYPIEKQLALLINGTPEQMNVFRQFIARVKNEVNNAINE